VIIRDLCAGLGGWAEGFLAEGYTCIGYDIERHDYGSGGYPGLLVLQDILTMHGSECKDASVIVASPPCQKYSYMAMPWKWAKALAAWYRESPERIEELNALFNACFRIQREASEAAGRYIPLIVENVRGAEKWVGSARWHFGSYYLWGDVPALMPPTVRVAMKEGVTHRSDGATNWHKIPGFRFDGSGSFQSAAVAGLKSPGTKLSEVGFNVRNAQRFREEQGRKNDGSGYNERGLLKSCNRMVPEGLKCGGSWFGKGNNQSLMRRHSSGSDSRKAASAEIAKIPFPLANHIAKCFIPRDKETLTHGAGLPCNDSELREIPNP
jgi:hypothetical protein